MGTGPRKILRTAKLNITEVREIIEEVLRDSSRFQSNETLVGASPFMINIRLYTFTVCVITARNLIGLILVASDRQFLKNHLHLLSRPL